MGDVQEIRDVMSIHHPLVIKTLVPQMHPNIVTTPRRDPKEGEVRNKHRETLLRDTIGWECIVKDDGSSIASDRTLILSFVQV